jgi:hypothetical protein
MKVRKSVLAVVSAVLAVSAITLWDLAARTESEILAHRSAVLKAAAAAPSPVPTAEQLAALPAPVRRYLAFAFPGPVPRLSHVEIDMEGQFRRPKTTAFATTSASQTIATATPALVFTATTPLLPGVWARVYDAYVGGRMAMKAKILSAVAVVDETSSPELDRLSLRRWLIESPLYPLALLPGGPVRWEPIDDRRARAVVSHRGLTASLVVSFAADGRLLRMDSETDGDLTTSYHGSGEHAARDDYQRVGAMMIPMKFIVARAAGGRLYPFWEGRVTRIRFSGDSAPGEVASAGAG